MFRYPSAPSYTHSPFLPAVEVQFAKVKIENKIRCQVRAICTCVFLKGHSKTKYKCTWGLCTLCALSVPLASAFKTFPNL